MKMSLGQAVAARLGKMRGGRNKKSSMQTKGARGNTKVVLRKPQHSSRKGC